MIAHKKGPFVILRMVGIYGHAAYLVSKICWTCSKREARLHWRFCVSESERGE
jgi:hypothetical protein